jgi:glycine hydroxymethyltransferase
MSPLAISMLGTKLDDKCASGRSGYRHHAGISHIDRIEEIAHEMIRRLFNVKFVEYRPLSGSISNMVATLSLVSHKDVIIAIPEKFGGHWTYGRRGYPDYAGVEIVDIPILGNDEMTVDLDGLSRIAKKVNPKIIIVGRFIFLFPEPVSEVRRIADENGAILLYDSSHVLGLIAGGEFQDPLTEGADLISGSTQKTFPGPIGGLLLTDNPDLARLIQGTSDNLISNYVNGRIAAMAVACAEMLCFGNEYAKAIVNNAKALAECLHHNGLSILGKENGFTASHQIVMDDPSLEKREKPIARLEKCGILSSRVKLPRDWDGPDGKETGIRLGVADITRRGMGTGEMEFVARLVTRALLTDETDHNISRDVIDIMRSFQQIYYCFPSDL